MKQPASTDGPARWAVGVDVGGTFTDLIARDAVTGTLRYAKVPTTLADQSVGVLAAITEANVDLAETVLVVHGTTTTTNAVLERKLATTGLITTEGFRDVLELGRRTRPAPYGMTGRFEPIIPRDLRLEVPERVLANGEVRTPLDEQAVREAGEALLALGCESVVVHFLHSYRYPQHEQRAAALLAELWPNTFVCTGHSLLSESREFERGVTAAVNASVQPLLQRYLENLAQALNAKGYREPLLVVNGNGGMVASDLVPKEAVKTVMSGPASGVIAAAWTGAASACRNLITYDMGGTSTDVALIRDAKPAVAAETDIEYGMPIHVPLVDVRTVGAGGGSIARIDAGGLLSVGPQSAGSSPGPVIYGRGGVQPTISDANALLGRLNLARVASSDDGSLIMHARDIVQRELGQPLGLSAEEAALAVIRVANTRMAGAIRMVSLSIGADPRDFSLFAFGGAGPLHASALARELGIPTVLVPIRPGITNALGCLVADIRHDFVNTLSAPLDSLDIAELHALIKARIDEGEALIHSQSIVIERIDHRLAVDMQFVGQTHLLRVPLHSATPSREELQASFEHAYDVRFRVQLPEIRAALMNVAVSVVGVRAPLPLLSLVDQRDSKSAVADAQTAEREVIFEQGRLTTPVYRREYLPSDARLQGPAIIEQSDTTTLIEPGDNVHGDGQGNLLVTVDRSASS